MPPQDFALADKLRLKSVELGMVIKDTGLKCSSGHQGIFFFQDDAVFDAIPLPGDDDDPGKLNNENVLFTTGRDWCYALANQLPSIAQRVHNGTHNGTHPVYRCQPGEGLVESFDNHEKGAQFPHIRPVTCHGSAATFGIGDEEYSDRCNSLNGGPKPYTGFGATAMGEWGLTGHGGVPKGFQCREQFKAHWCDSDVFATQALDAVCMKTFGNKPPYSCTTRTSKYETSEKLALAWSNTQLMWVILMAIFVSFFRHVPGSSQHSRCGSSESGHRPDSTSKQLGRTKRDKRMVV